MHHVAIMKKSWGLTEKILTGEKTIESRWYEKKCAPWSAIKAGDTVYFKNSGEAVKTKADVKRVMQIELAGPNDVKKILNDYGREDGIETRDFSRFFTMFKNKKYCVLIFLRNARRVRPFNVDKSGFGAMAAWMTMHTISSIKSPAVE
jgi:ASC-1-like (ASCH) protein